MGHFLLDHEPAIRFGFFFGILVLMALWEGIAPRRPLTVSKKTRWFNNLGLVLIDTLALRLLLPLTAVGVALFVEKRGWGILHYLSLPAWMAVIIGVLTLDLVIYIQHAVFHFIPTLWRLHRVHHTDLDIDVTTGVRFHPAEVVLSMGIKMAVVFLLGAPVLAVLLFEVILNSTSMFNHGNVRMGRNFDRWLRLFLVTPDMHRVHHSVIIRETNSNFGFNFPWWDRLFGTYRAQPANGHDRMVIGLSRYRDPKYLTLVRLLALPFLPEPI